MLLSNYSIKFRTAVFVFIVAIVLIGGYCYMSLPREGMPDITIPYIFVTAVYEGTSPEEIEKLITVPLEKQLNDVENIKELRSSSFDSVCSVTIEFLAGEDIETAKRRVKDKADLARPDLPTDLDQPVVRGFNVSSDYPIFRLSISGPADVARLKGLAEDLKDRIELVSGVKEAAVFGTREREIRVEIDLTRLIARDIPIGAIMQRISQENSTMSAGNIEVAGDKFQVRVPGEFESVSELRDIVVATRRGKQVYLRDVATVADTYKDLETISRLNGNAAVSINVKKRVGENSVRLIRELKKTLKEFRFPPGVNSTVVYDESDYVDMMISELENNIASGFILVALILLLFMGGRNSLFVALAIPFSMLTAFAVMAFIGFSLNMMVLFGLVLAVGMLVDNAIVIVENIYRLRTEGMSRTAAAREGAAEVAWPVITSTLTTCAAFSPLLFWPDVMGQFMSFLPRTLIIVLMASLFVAIVINPAVCSAFISRGKKADRRESQHWFSGGYEYLLRGALRHRVPVLLLGFLFLVLTVLIYAWLDRGVELFPETEPRNATVNVKFSQGTSIERTDAALRRVEEVLSRYEDIQFYGTTVGSGGQNGLFGGGGSGGHMGSIHIEFVDAKDRKENSTKLVERIREELGAVPGAEVQVEKQEEGPQTGAPVSIELSGDDFDVLSRYSSEIIRKIETIPGLVDVRDDLEDALPEIQFRVDRQRAALLGLDTDAIGLFLRTSIYGLETSKFRADEDEYDITLRLPKGRRQTIDILDQIFIPTPVGTSVPLSSIGTVIYTGGRGAISRKDQKRVITITGNDQGRGVDRIMADVRVRLEGLELPPGYHVEYAGDTKEMRESGVFLARAFAVAIALIVVILVVQFNSAVLPAIIVFSVILSLIGVMWGLIICRMRFGVIMTGVGVISLAGIVVNNAIVLIDCIIQRERSGLPAIEAIVQAGRTRLRPVLLTATTTILGLIPMAVGFSLDVHNWPPSFVAGQESSAWWKPMAVAVMFGLGVATVLTLVLVPLMYSVAHSMSAAARRILGPADD